MAAIQQNEQSQLLQQVREIALKGAQKTEKVAEKTEPERQLLPDPHEITQTYAQVAQRSSKLLSDYLRRQMTKGVSAPSDDLGIAQAFMEMQLKMLSNPYRLVQLQINLIQDYLSLWQHEFLRHSFLHAATPVALPEKGDNRFKDEDWQEHFLFDFIKQSYLITAHHIHEAVTGVDGLSENTSKKVHFYTHQFIDALSPSNFAMTNPEVLRETVKSHGQNLLNGLNNLLRDIEEGDGQLKVKMTDTSVFEVGRNVGYTPSKVVFQTDLMQLLQFDPATKDVLKRPLLIVPPWINKYYILDLRDKNSYIKWATEQGHTVFVISWVNPDEKMAEKSFEDYLSEGTLAALDAIYRQTGEKEVNAAGYCLGGTLLASTMAYLAAKNDKRIASGTFFTTLIDFTDPGELGVFIDEQQVSYLEKKMEQQGYMEGKDMALTFGILRANDLVWSFVVNNYLMGKQPFPFDLLFWNSDSTRMPYKMHSFYLRNMYLRNLLREPDGMELLGTPIDMRKITAPCYFISTVEDHIAPWKSTYQGARLMGGPLRFVLGGSGHIAGIVNPPSSNKYGHWTNDSITTGKSLPAEPDTWLSNAKQNPGSWWSDWHQWVGKLAPETIPARDPAKGKLKVLENGPGSYVKFGKGTQEKADK